MACSRAKGLGSREDDVVPAELSTVSSVDSNRPERRRVAVRWENRGSPEAVAVAGCEDDTRTAVLPCNRA